MILIGKKGDENMKLREIKKIWTVNEQKISPIHTAGSSSCTWKLGGL